MTPSAIKGIAIFVAFCLAFPFAFLAYIRLLVAFNAWLFP